MPESRRQRKRPRMLSLNLLIIRIRADLFCFFLFDIIAVIRPLGCALIHFAVINIPGSDPFQPFSLDCSDDRLFPFSRRAAASDAKHAVRPAAAFCIFGIIHLFANKNGYASVFCETDCFSVLTIVNVRIQRADSAAVRLGEQIRAVLLSYTSVFYDPF